MTWLYSIVAAGVSGIVGLLLAGFIANACVSWYHVSSREGASGFFVMFLGLGGGIAGFLLGLIVARWIAAHGGSHLGRELAGAVAAVILVAGISALLCRLLADVPPRIDGQELTLEVEFRFPNTLDQAKPPTAEGQWTFTFASLSGYTCRKRDLGTIRTEAARLEQGQWIVPTTVSLFTERGKRSVSLAPDGAQESFGFLLPLPRRPGREFLEWSGWFPRQQAGGQPWPADKMSCRYRLQKVPLPPPPKSHEDLMSEKAAEEEAKFLAIPPDSPVQAWFSYLSHEQPYTKRAVEQISRHPDLVAQLQSLAVNEDPEVAYSALKCIGMLPTPPRELVPVVQAAARVIESHITRFNNTSKDADPDFALAVDPATRFYGWMLATESLREKCAADFVPELQSILQLSNVRAESHCMRVDIGEQGRSALGRWTRPRPPSAQQ